MTTEELQALISEILPNSEVTVDGDGYHFNATVISPDFTNLTTVKRQQLIYKGLSDLITSGAVHALSLTTFTPEEWKQQHG